MDLSKDEVGKIAKRVSYYLWLSSGIMLLGMFEAFYRDSMHELPNIDLSLGGCFKIDTGDLDNFSITGEAELAYSDSTDLPDSATLSFHESDSFADLNITPFFDGECIAKITHPIAEAIKYSALISIGVSATVLAIEILAKKNNIAKTLSTYLWLLAGAMTIGVFDAFYRDTLHELPNLDLSMGGCVVVGPGDYPESLEPGVIQLSYDDTHYPPQTASFTLNPMKELAGYQPTFLFRKECVAQITKPFGRSLEIGFFIGLGLSAGTFALEQWVRKYGWTLPCRQQESDGELEHVQLNNAPPSDGVRVRADSDDSISHLNPGEGGDIELGETKHVAML